MRVFHVSDERIDRFVPRPSPQGTDLAGQALVWAIDEERLPHYLLPRSCPRVCWFDGDRRTIAIEAAWTQRVAEATVVVHELASDGFRPITDWWGDDDPSGYWIAEHAPAVVAVEVVDDCAVAIRDTGAGLVAVDDLWAVLDEVRHLPFSAIRMRNARTAG